MASISIIPVKVLTAMVELNGPAFEHQLGSDTFSSIDAYRALFHWSVYLAAWMNDLVFFIIGLNLTMTLPTAPPVSVLSVSSPGHVAPAQGTCMCHGLAWQPHAASARNRFSFKTAAAAAASGHLHFSDKRQQSVPVMNHFSRRIRKLGWCVDQVQASSDSTCPSVTLLIWLSKPAY